MTYEETMNRCSRLWNTLISGCSITIEPTSENIEWAAMCAEASERRIQAEPHFEGDGYWRGELVYDTWVCPNCYTDYEVETDKYNYCPNCGQAIDWGEE